ncbi:putative Co/Zn/Cd efflux system membrane fusion protein [Fimbriiglobus ruber]|uniref:Putative Co/Zn/Cd efflux system membrane fusion protein n=1 Tax=Fimbriiglobus ruber TaxID=1908690 RepID=A0A225D424_9BACT|nr:putative Co/Zn/Cd efflux system membrane fusion protein [Fimbriiglobus ruber]
MLAATLAFGTGCGGPKDGTSATGAGKDAPVTVTTAPLTTRLVPRTVPAVGTLYGYEEATLSPKVDGRVIAIHADVGDMVVPGSVLLELDPVDCQKEVDRAQKAMELELARLDLQILLTKEQFKAADVPAVRRAQFTLTSAEREFNRVKSLGGVSDREFRAAETELSVAAASRNVAISEANAGLATAWLKKSELEQAEQRLHDTVLRAPVPAGWEAWAAMVGPGFSPLRYSVAQRMLSEGEMVRSMPVTNAFKLVIDHALKLRAAVPERFTPDVKVGQPADVRVDAYSDHVFHGRVARVNPTVDTATRTFMVEIEVPNLDGRLKAGGFARAAILTRTDAAVKSVPPQAIVNFAGVNKVFVVANEKAKAVVVDVGTRDKDWIEVIGDVTNGATVVTSGQTQLVDGSAVRVRP